MNVNPLKFNFPASHSLLENSQILQQKTLILLLEPENSSQREQQTYICGLRARIECEPLREHSTHSDRVTNIGLLLSLGASYLLHKFRIFKLFFFARRMEAILFFSILVTISVKPKYSFPKLIKAGRTSEAIPCCCHFFRME